MTAKAAALIAVSIAAVMVIPPALAGALGDPLTVAVAAGYSFFSAFVAAGVTDAISRKSVTS